MTDLNSAVFAKVDGERKQVGTATTSNDGVRRLNLFEDFKHAELNDVEFQDNFETVAQVEDANRTDTPELPASEPQLDTQEATEVAPEQPAQKRTR